MSTNTTPSTPSPEHSHDPEDDEPVLLPIYLVEDDEIPDLLHPECCIRKIPNTPPDDPGIECVIFRREDYSEKDNEDYTFGGLLLLERELFGPDDFADPAFIRPSGQRTLRTGVLPKSSPAPAALKTLRSTLTENGPAAGGIICATAAAATFPSNAARRLKTRRRYASAATYRRWTNRRRPGS